MANELHRNQIRAGRWRSPKHPELAEGLNSLARLIEELYDRPQLDNVGGGLQMMRSGNKISLFLPFRSEATASAVKYPLMIHRTAPPNWDHDANPVAANDYFINWGLVNTVEPSGLDTKYTVAATTWFFMRIYLDEALTHLVSSAEIVTGPNSNSHESEDFEAGELPAYVVYPLGKVNVVDDIYTVQHQGYGSLKVAVYMHDTECESGETTFKRYIDVGRDSGVY